MVYSFLFARLEIEIPEGLPRAPSGLLTEEHFDGSHAYCTLIRDLGERLSEYEKKAPRKQEKDDAWWNEIGM